MIIWAMKIILYSSSVYSCHLFLISSASVRSLPFLSFIEPIFAWNVTLVSLIFCKRFYSFPFCCFPLLLCIDHWRGLSCLSLLLLNSAFRWEYLSFSPLLFTSLLFTAICKASSEAILPLCISFPWGWSWSLSPIQCHEPLSIVHQALCLSDLVP